MQIIIGILIGAIFVYYILTPKIKEKKEIDKDIQEANKGLRQIYCETQDNIRVVKSEYIDLQKQYKQLLKEKDELLADLHSKELEFKTLESGLQDRLSIAADNMGKKYQKDIEDYEKQYQSVMNDLAKEYQNIVKNEQEKIQLLQNEYNDLYEKNAAAVEANKRKQEIEDNDKFYKLNLLDIDLQEIKKLREVSKYLRDTEPLNKVIWKVYYEKPYTDLIGRVVGSAPTTGIYKITNLKNGMCYVGQAVNIADRFKQHIKRGIGAETPTRNKLYPAMAEYGVENFSFEIIEKCSKDKLNEKEDFWQDYFKAKEFGYSIK